MEERRRFYFFLLVCLFISYNFFIIVEKGKKTKKKKEKEKERKKKKFCLFLFWFSGYDWKEGKEKDPKERTPNSHIPWREAQIRFRPESRISFLNFILCNSPAMNKKWFLIIVSKRLRKRLKESASFQAF